ncbi:unnamed protein product [Anisakis simplex]|uniref:Uncharacterized protein n=1 Tax=Anisakis simplex TaxID=6269 RepID=A0A3P6R1E1_ANISI|nr:unnamed protein product [Anisakis simplex]
MSTKRMLTAIICLMLLIVIILLNICILKYPGSCFRKQRDGISQVEMTDSAQRVYSTQPIIRSDKRHRHSRDRTSTVSQDNCASSLPFLQYNLRESYLRLTDRRHMYI